MYKCDLVLKNKAEWLSYAKELLYNTDKTADELLEEILTFPFEFGGVPISQ
ncbi:hypothetical protein [Lacrimispora indolis]|uniref:hypothetical protein n=1 Tax=Lacrimispora indolis TaxID=69825 RepID=UPI00040F343E|nr:hypothetical protein [[Clostridium] methoxybenzovorans]